MFSELVECIVFLAVCYVINVLFGDKSNPNKWF